MKTIKTTSILSARILLLITMIQPLEWTGSFGILLSKNGRDQESGHSRAFVCTSEPFLFTLLSKLELCQIGGSYIRSVLRMQELFIPQKRKDLEWLVRTS
jgi:hypothetical protein